MPRGGARPNSGGSRPGAGRKRTKPTMQVELTEQATRELLYFLEDLNLDRSLAPAIVSEMVLAALRDSLDRWRDRFGNSE
jgi:hypothetical protein